LLVTLKNRLDSNTKELSTCQSLLEKNQLKQQNQEEEISALEQEINLKSKELRAVKVALADKESENEALESSKQVIQSKINSLEKLKESISKDLNNANDNMAELQKSCEETLKTNFANYQEKMVNLGELQLNNITGEYKIREIERDKKKIEIDLQMQKELKKFNEELSLQLKNSQEELNTKIEHSRQQVQQINFEKYISKKQYLEKKISILQLEKKVEEEEIKIRLRNPAKINN